MKFTYPSQRLKTSSLFRYTLFPGGGGVLPYKSDGGARLPFRGLNLYVDWYRLGC